MLWAYIISLETGDDDDDDDMAVVVMMMMVMMECAQYIQGNKLLYIMTMLKYE